MHNSCISAGLPTGLNGPYQANDNSEALRNTLYNRLYAHENSIPKFHFHLEVRAKC